MYSILVTDDVSKFDKFIIEFSALHSKNILCILVTKEVLQFDKSIEFILIHL